MKEELSSKFIGIEYYWKNYREEFKGRFKFKTAFKIINGCRYARVRDYGHGCDARSLRRYP